MAKIVELQTRRDHLRRDQEALVRQAVLDLEEELPGGVVRELLTVIDRRSASRGKWSFVMLSPHQNYIVVSHILSTSKRPLLASQLWATCFTVLRSDTGEIMLTRDELAERLETTPQNISSVMTELVEFGAIIRRRVRVKNMRGPGMVQYFMNPRVATHLPGSERDKAQDEAPPLLDLMSKPRLALVKD